MREIFITDTIVFVLKEIKENSTIKRKRSVFLHSDKTSGDVHVVH